MRLTKVAIQILALGWLAALPRAAAMQLGQVTQVTLAPASPVTAGTTVTVTVAARGNCHQIEINFGDGAVQTFVISTLPLIRTHTYANAGAFTVAARGVATCGGNVSTALQVVPPTQLTVRALEPNGNPVPLATVCMAQGSQGGSRLTTGGVAVLTGLPAGAYTLHVIKSNFQTNSQSVNLSGTQELTVTLQPGASTPPAGVNCQGGGAGTTLPPVTITSFEVVDLPADFTVTSPPLTHLRLKATFDRAPAFFRIVEASAYASTPVEDLRTVPWLPILPPSTSFTNLFRLDLARPYGTRVVRLQVANLASEASASQIKSVSVILAPGGSGPRSSQSRRTVTRVK